MNTQARYIFSLKGIQELIENENTRRETAPHCKKKFIYTYRGSGTVEVEPPERDEEDD